MSGPTEGRPRATTPGPQTPQGLAQFASELDALRDHTRQQLGEVDARTSAAC